MDKINDNYLFFNPNITKKNDIKKKKNISTTGKNKSAPVFTALFENSLVEEQDQSEVTELNREALLGEISLALKEIGQQGKRFKERRTIEELEKYKHLINSFIRKILHASEEVVVKTIYNAKRKEKISKLHFKMLDKELLELTRIFIEEQQNTIKLGAQIDRIEGILVDLAS